jgi:hypothetical protein
VIGKKQEKRETDRDLERIKMSLFTENMIVYVVNPKEPRK